MRCRRPLLGAFVLCAGIMLGGCRGPRGRVQPAAESRDVCQAMATALGRRAAPCDAPSQSDCLRKWLDESLKLLAASEERECR